MHTSHRLSFRLRPRRLGAGGGRRCAGRATIATERSHNQPATAATAALFTSPDFRGRTLDFLPAAGGGVRPNLLTVMDRANQRQSLRRPAVRPSATGPTGRAERPLSWHLDETSRVIVQDISTVI